MGYWKHIATIKCSFDNVYYLQNIFVRFAKGLSCNTCIPAVQIIIYEKSPLVFHFSIQAGIFFPSKTNFSFWKWNSSILFLPTFYIFASQQKQITLNLVCRASFTRSETEMPCWQWHTPSHLKPVCQRRTEMRMFHPAQSVSSSSCHYWMRNNSEKCCFSFVSSVSI